MGELQLKIEDKLHRVEEAARCTKEAEDALAKLEVVKAEFDKAESERLEKAERVAYAAPRWPDARARALSTH